MFDNFIGNSNIKSAIKSAVISGRFPHAFIIEGEKNSGRHTLAKIIAAAAICQSDDAPCGKCRECELIEKNSHCDVLTYAPDGATFKVDTVREIRDNAYIMPIEAKRKVNILLDCDKMTEQAQNALLKVLEEPPAFMVFILICRSSSALLSTIRSRCITLSVQNPEIDEAIPFLKLKTGKSEQDINDALTSSHGNIGEALSILNGELNQVHDDANAFFDTLVKKSRLEALKILLKYEKDRLKFNLFLSEFGLVLNNEIKSYALGKEASIRPKELMSVLSVVEEAKTSLLTHIGQPLNLQIIETDICAKIFKILR